MLQANFASHGLFLKVHLTALKPEVYKKQQAKKEKIFFDSLHHVSNPSLLES